MILQNILDLCDQSYVAERQDQININYVASSEVIFSDGTFDTSIRSDGYISIGNISNASYIMFIDQNGDLFLSIYQYIAETRFKQIVDAINTIRGSTGMRKHNVIHDRNNRLTIETDGIVDLNALQCPECGKEMSKRKSSEQTETIIAECKACGVEYALVPSKYYLIRAYKKTYPKNNNSRNLGSIEQ